MKVWFCSTSNTSNRAAAGSPLQKSSKIQTCTITRYFSAQKKKRAGGDTSNSRSRVIQHQHKCMVHTCSTQRVQGSGVKHPGPSSRLPAVVDLSFLNPHLWSCPILSTSSNRIRGSLQPALRTAAINRPGMAPTYLQPNKKFAAASTHKQQQATY